MRARSIGVGGALIAMAVGASCGADQPGTSNERAELPLTVAAVALPSSPVAHRSVAALRERFRVTPMAQPEMPGRPPEPAPVSAPVIRGGVATSFEPTGAASVRAVIPSEAKRAVLRAASVELPLRANAMARVEDDVTHVSVGFALRDAGNAELTVADGMARYEGALRGSDVVHRVHAEGTEDFVVFETRPAREELVYDVDVTRVAGLRLVSNTLEFLDEGGAPRLRVAPPYVVDASGERSEARIAVEGCAYDTDASGPWGRAVTKAGASRCGVRVVWSGVGYPLIVDPQWTATGSMAAARYEHTATLLPSGKVLVTGGYTSDGVYLSSSELFDGTVSFAATGSMLNGRRFHTATLLPSGRVLIAGGYHGTSLASAELFDGSATFAATGAMATGRYRHTATLLPSGKVLIAGGWGPGPALSSAELFDGNASFTATGALATTRAMHTATLLPSGKVLVAGGYNGGYGASAELFDGNATFSPIGSMATARRTHTATRLLSGKVLITGGYNGSALSSAELFDGNAGFLAAGSMAMTRNDHAATLLPSGKVLITGGSGASFYLSSAELFDGSAAFAINASMATGREAPTATLLPSGQVLVAGGFGVGGTLSSAELLGAPAGALCGAADECGSGVCNDGTCCASACGGLCVTCAPGTGACTPVKNAVDPNSCGPSTYALVSVYQGGAPDVNALDFQSGFVSESAVADNSKGKSAVRFTATTDATPGNPNKYAYWRFSTASRVIQAGDHVEYDVYLESALPETGGIDIQNTDGTYWRGEPDWMDQNGVGGHPSYDIAPYATGQWYHRILAVPKAVIGKTIASWDVVNEDNAISRTTSAYYANVAITNGINGVTSNVCDASGVCKLALGQAAADPAACASTFASDGVCCDTACDAACDVCTKSLGAIADGTCSIAPAAYAGSPECGNGFACDGADVTCPASCVSDADCLADDYCAANGTCRARGLQGESCSPAAGVDCFEADCRQCASDHCVDGVCCDTACDTVCLACSAALKESAAHDGVCDSAKAQSKPHNGTCPDDGPDSCGPNGLCSGAGACSLYYPPGTSCGASVCLPGKNKAAGNLCDGAGVCAADPVGVSCGDTVCANGSCPATCASDANCIPMAYCDQGTKACRPRGPCTSAAQCTSGFCVDGFCCNSACEGQCEACNVNDGEGTCVPVAGPPVGKRTACAPGDVAHPCAKAECNGKLAKSCAGFVGASQACGDASCTSGLGTLTGACDGTGDCQVPDAVPCGAYACGPTACNPSCTADAHCASGNTCDTSTGKCVSGATCGKDGHTASGANGTTIDCAPFNCDSTGACKTTCGSIDDCSAPNVCDASHHCTAPGASGSSGDSGGCAVAALPREGSPSRASALLLALGLAGLAVRRRRSGRRSLVV